MKAGHKSEEDLAVRLDSDMLRGFDFRRTEDGQTFAILESLSRLKILPGS